MPRKRPSRLPRLQQIIGQGIPGELREMLANWGSITLPLTVDLSARMAIDACRPQMLAVALDPVFRPPPPMRGPELVPGRQIYRVMNAVGQWLAADASARAQGKPPVRRDQLAQAPALVDALAAAGCPLEDSLGGGETHPLTVAAALDQVELARCLLRHGVDPAGQFPDAHELQPYPLARARTAAMVELLLDASPRVPPLSVEALAGWQTDLEWLLSAWRARGGQWEAPLAMEHDQRPTTLPAYAFLGTDLGPGSRPQPGSLRDALQRALVACRFDLDALAPDGRPWRVHARRSAGQALRVWMDLSQLPAGKPAQAGPRL